MRELGEYFHSAIFCVGLGQIFRLKLYEIFFENLLDKALGECRRKGVNKEINRSFR